MLGVSHTYYVACPAQLIILDLIILTFEDYCDTQFYGYYLSYLRPEYLPTYLVCKCHYQCSSHRVWRGSIPTDYSVQSYGWIDELID